MKQKLLFIFLLFLSSLAGAQSPPVTAQLTASAASCAVGASPTACLFLQVAQNIGMATVDLEGTFSATVQFEQSSDGGNTWRAVSGSPSSAGASVTSATAAGTWQISAGAYHYIRVRVSTYSSGTVIATITPSKAGSSSSNGFNGGSLPASATVLGTNSSGQPIDNSAATLANNTTGSAATLSPSANFIKTASGTANATTLSQQNLVLCAGFQTGAYGGTFTKISYNVNTADNTANLYDIGIAVAATGARVCHTGAIAGTSSFPGAGQINASTTGNCVLTANTKYFVTLTSSAASPLAKMGAELGQTFQNTATACGTSASGVIPDPLTAVPADSWVQGGVPTVTLHN